MEVDSIKRTLPAAFTVRDILKIKRKECEIVDPYPVVKVGDRPECQSCSSPLLNFAITAVKFQFENQLPIYGLLLGFVRFDRQLKETPQMTTSNSSHKSFPTRCKDSEADEY